MKTFVLIVALAVAAPASAEWRRVNSPNFIVVGDVSARDLRATATKLEGFRETLRRVLPAVTSSSPVPTVVVVFPSDEAFTPFKPTYQGKPKSIAGYAAPGSGISYIAMLNAGEYSDRVIFHEYTHMIVANAVTRVPVWLNEGLAEFYSSFALMDGGKRAQIGRPLEEHLRVLNGAVRIPLVELLKADASSPLYNEQNRASDFYAESWALTHMLLNGQPSRSAELSDYLQRVNNGTSEAQAWEQVFGTARTENQFRQYVIRPTYMTGLVDFAEKITSVPVTEGVLSPASVAPFLAALELRISPDAAAKRLERALKQEPANALANVAMARVDLARHESTNAAKRLMAMPAIDDWFAAYDTAVTLIDVANLEPRTDAVPTMLARATMLLDQVQRERADLPNVLASQARIELLGDSPPSPAAHERIARARSLAPGRIDYALMQAELFANARDFTRARAVIGPLMTPVYPEDVRNAARRLMGGLVDLEQQLERGAVGPTAAATSVLPAATGAPRSVAVPDADADTPRTGAGPTKFRPAFRPLQEGEQRLDGMLERIDCPAGKPAVFHVRTATESIELEAAMREVQFVTFRDDLNGGVTCGPRTAMRVYATWRDGTSSRHEKVVVAVEFLPRD
jgi:hypothetical protein